MSTSVVFRSVALAGFIVVGCANRDCLPLPVTDVSSPEVTLTILYRDPASGRQNTRVVTAEDSLLHFEASNAGGVSVVYAGRDAEGIRRLQLGATILTTVGVGIESRKVSSEPLTSTCPVVELAGTWTSPQGDPDRTVSLGLIAENWIGLRSWTETVTVRLK